MKTSELTDRALDWAVTRIEHPEYDPTVWVEYSTEWDYGGPIIEREGIAICPDNDGGFFAADAGGGRDYRGETYLIAAMRCYVASKLGDEVEIPEELK